MIPVYRTYLPQNSLRFAHEALDSTWISSHGEYIEKVQTQLQDLLGVKHALLVNNGTSATHLVAKALMYRHPEVNTIIVPNNVYVAAINSFLFDRKYQLISVDCELATWNYDLNLLDAAIHDNPGPLAVLCVHNVGNIIDVPMLQDKYPQVVFVEDNCEGFLGKYNWSKQYSGTASLASSISFFGNKIISSGQGGCVLLNDTDTYNHLKCIHGQGQSSVRFVHEMIGNNFRITNVEAGLLHGQLEILPQILELKNNIFTHYRVVIGSIPGVDIQIQEISTEHSNWMFGLRVIDNPHGYSHAEKYFNDRGIEIRPMFYPISAHGHLKNEPLLVEFGEHVNAQILNAECFILPSYPELTTDELNYICNTVESYVKSI